MTATGKKYRTGITTEQIIDTAVELTRQRGLYGWSIRELVEAVDTSPSVVYHRVGGRDAVYRGVVARVLAEIDSESPGGTEPSRRFRVTNAASSTTEMTTVAATAGRPQPASVPVSTA
jgi:AcrR family transcriptional regulator